MRRLQLILALSVLLGSAIPDPARANLVLVGPEDFPGSGLGAVNTILTITSPMSSSTEQGCVGRSTTVGCPSGVANASSDFIGGTLGGDEQTGASQTLTRTVAQLGLTTAENIRVVFNASEPTGNGITLETLVLTIYNADNTIQFSGGLAAPVVFADTLTGVGNSGFVFALNAAQAAAAGALAADDRIGLSARATDATGGLETFFVAEAVPEPTTLLILGSGLVGIGVWRRRTSSI